MMQFLKNLLTKKAKADKLPAKPYLLWDKYEVIPAFEFRDQTYFMHKDPMNTCLGRGLITMAFYEEMLMRCDVAYLKEYCAAIKAIFSNPNKVDLAQLFKITNHLEERVNFLAAVPEHVYKLASVVFFTEDESAFYYDQERGMEKVKAWEAEPGMYDFFLKGPLVDLVPFLALPDSNSENYLQVQKKIEEIHLKSLREVLSSGVSQAARMN